MANTIITRKEIQESLDLHLSQIERLGYHLEDQCCCVFRKLLEYMDERNITQMN